MKLKPICLAFALAFTAATAMPTLAAAPKAVVAAKATAYTSVEGITEYRLPNGLRVLLAPDASKPTTTVNVTYLAGSRHESYGETKYGAFAGARCSRVPKTVATSCKSWASAACSSMAPRLLIATNYFETFLPVKII